MKKAVWVTGAAARIAQEVAILDILFDKGLKLSEDDTILAGYSSGSINLLALNGAFRKKNPLPWDTFYKLQLFNLTNDNVFKLLPPTGCSLFNTAPFRKFIKNIMCELGYSNFGDLEFVSYVIASQKTTKATNWAYNRLDGNKQLNPVDLFMASTAIPIMLPPIEIESNDPSVDRKFPEGYFQDGGTYGTFVNFNVILDDIRIAYGDLEEIHIISPMRENLDQTHDMIKNGLVKAAIEKEKHEGIIQKMEHFSINVGLKAFQEFIVLLDQYNTKNPIAKNIYISIPAMTQNTPFLDFDAQQSAYNTTYKWLTGAGKDQVAVPIKTYIQNDIPSLLSAK